jgi:hypothetical protein
MRPLSSYRFNWQGHCNWCQHLLLLLLLNLLPSAVTACAVGQSHNQDHCTLFLNAFTSTALLGSTRQISATAANFPRVQAVRLWCAEVKGLNI